MTKTRLKRKNEYFPTAWNWFQIPDKTCSNWWPYTCVIWNIMKLKISSPCGSSVVASSSATKRSCATQIGVFWISPPTVAVILALISDENRPELMPGEETKQLWWVASSWWQGCLFSFSRLHKLSRMQHHSGPISLGQELQRALETKLDPRKDVAHHPPSMSKVWVVVCWMCFLHSFITAWTLRETGSRYRCYHYSICFVWCVCVPISMVISVWSHSETFIPPLPLMGDLFLQTQKTFILSAIEGGS